MHGESDSKLYDVWIAIKYRTGSPKCTVWSSYGGRGITMHPAWRESFLTFKRDVAPLGYGPGLTLDREDNDGNYEPGNVRWVTQAIQTLNQRTIKVNNTSGYRGVLKTRGKDRWRAYITYEYRQIHLGTFKSPRDAAQAYNDASKRLRGDLGFINEL